MKRSLRVNLDHNGTMYVGACYIEGQQLVLDVPQLGRKTAHAALADHKLEEAARILVTLLLTQLGQEKWGAFIDEESISVHEQPQTRCAG